MEFSVCPTNLTCGCKLRKSKYQIFKYHYKRDGCRNVRHSKFPPKKFSHFVVDKKPVWYYDCHVPYTDDKNIKVLKLWKFLGIECKCLPGKCCAPCLATATSKTFQHKNSTFDLDLIFKLDPFIRWDKVVL